MKTSFIYSLWVVASLATASVIPRQHGFVPANSCCFTLHDASTGALVREDRTNGFLQLGGSNPDGWFCINLSEDAGVLRDESKNACFVAPNNEIKCKDQMPGPQTWDIISSSKKGVRSLTYDGETSYKACSDGKNRESLWGVDKGGCRKVKVEAKGFKGAC